MSAGWVRYYESLIVNVHFVHFGRSSFSSSVGDTKTWRRRRFKPKLNFERECRFWVFGESRSSVRPWHPRDYNIVSTCHVMTSLIHLMQIIWYSFTIYNHMTNPSKFNTWKFLKFWSKISRPSITKKFIFSNILDKIDFFAELKFSWSFFG